ncbi:MAG: gamma-glutamyl-gamma-aminobutyrate hydrolase family protein [Pseudomonadota bacterium]
MKIGILETGKVPDGLEATHGSYTDLFRAFLGAAAPDASFLTVPVCEGAAPQDVRAVDGWIITGSRHGVYDPLAWIAPFEAMLRACRAARIPLFGVCFGHQIMAQAFGGRAEKASQGWSVGRHGYDFLKRPGWMAGAEPRFTQLAMHQDQVTRPPPDTTLLAGSARCPYAALAYGDPDRPWGLSVQPHPEFTDAFLADLVAVRRGGVLTTETADAALETLGRPARGADWARWCVALFEHWRT